MENKPVKKREANLELLRIVAMLMVITLHYLGKGGGLIYYEYFQNDVAPIPNIVLAWFLEAVCYGATNIYVLISGYFLVSSNFRMEKGIKLWIQIFFYSAGIFLLFLLLGKVPAEMNGIFWLAMYLTPSASQHYWFGSVYLLMYMFSPFLALISRKLGKKQLLGLIVCCMLVFSTLWTDILPFTHPIDDAGMGIAWFSTLFFIAAYIRLYVPTVKRKWILPIIFFACAILMTISVIGFGWFASKTGHMQNRQGMAYDYNSILVTVESIVIFLFFREIKIKDGFFAKAVCAVSGLTFGIYLCHENMLLRDLWKSFWNVPFHFSKGYFIVHLIVTVFVVFIAGAIVEFIRKTIFDLIYKIPFIKKIFVFVSKADSLFPNKEQ